MKLFDYFRSSTSYRVRIALQLKDLAYEMTHINLLEGRHREESYKQHNPSGGVPTLMDGDVTIAQSLAIIEYLDERYPAPKLIDGDAAQRALIRQLSHIISDDIHSLINLRVMAKLAQDYKAAEEQKQDWYKTWVGAGFSAYETLLGRYNKGRRFSVSDAPGMADLCLIPQLYSARRFKFDLSPFPEICRIERNCLALESFQKAAPESHPNAPADLEQIHGPRSPVLKQAA